MPLFAPPSIPRAAAPPWTLRATLLALTLLVPPAATAQAGDTDDWTPAPVRRGGLEAIATASDGTFRLHTAGGDRTFLPGINIGPTIPGRQPGEQAIPAEVFRRWFPQIQALGMKVVRVYTIMPPRFYAELAAFNRAHPSDPLYLVHGVWIPEERFYETRDLFTVEEAFHREIERVVGVVYGAITLPDRLGHAWGSYETDVTPWLIGWIVGVEWDPLATFESDANSAGRPPHRGRFFANPPDASSTEVWLARAMDHLATLEHGFGRTVPIAFTNWPTTDPLVHPDEPLEREDLVGVDANHVLPTEAWPGGSFASYHAYPYYPDFQRYEEGVADFVLDGRPDAYAGYLSKLRDHHLQAGLATLVTEFGVPSSIGSAHVGPQGRDQGGHGERAAMRIDADLMDTIHRVGLGGGFVFAWADEWFKFTWNTIDYELPPNRRQLWQSAWTNEAHFGLLAIESATVPAVVDGDLSEWRDNRSQVIYESRGAVRQVRAVKDEAYLYLAIVTDRDEAWRDAPLVIGFDVLTGGAPVLPGVGDVGWPSGDHAVVIAPDGSATSMVRASADPLLLQYAVAREMVPLDDPATVAPDSPVWNPHRLILNRPLTIPTSGERFPAELMTVGRMMRGTSDPADPAFDSRVTWQAAGSAVELRIPWPAVGFSDPSSRQAYRAHPDGTVTTETVERVGIVVAADGELHTTRGYAWAPWQTVDWAERPKAGLDALAATVRAILDAEADPSRTGSVRFRASGPEEHQLRIEPVGCREAQVVRLAQPLGPRFGLVQREGVVLEPAAGRAFERLPGGGAEVRGCCRIAVPGRVRLARLGWERVRRGHDAVPAVERPCAALPVQPVERQEAMPVAGDEGDGVEQVVDLGRVRQPVERDPRPAGPNRLESGLDGIQVGVGLFEIDAEQLVAVRSRAAASGPALDAE